MYNATSFDELYNSIINFRDSYPCVRNASLINIKDHCIVIKQKYLRKTVYIPITFDNIKVDIIKCS